MSSIRSIRSISWEEVIARAYQISSEVSREHPRGPLRVWGVPQGGVIPAVIFQQACQQQGVPAVLVESPSEADVAVDDIVDSGYTMGTTLTTYPNIRHFLPLFTKDAGDTAWYVFPWERARSESPAEDAVRRVIEAIGDDPDREGLKETPARVSRSWSHLFSGYGRDPGAVLKTFTEGACDEIVVIRDIEFYSTCEHHLLPFFGKAHIGYLPNGRVVGISKVVRVLEIFSRRLQIQERIGQQVTDALMEHLKPLGCGCVLEARHLCMMSRGVEKQNSAVVTSSVCGCFLEASVKSEFLRMIGR